MDAVPQEIAVRLCAEIREVHRRKLFSAARWQCWGCVKFTKGAQEKMCGQIVACNLVVPRYRALRESQAGQP